MWVSMEGEGVGVNGGGRVWVSMEGEGVGVNGG